MREYALQIVDETLVLHSERALWWPAGRCLMVADVHFGKGSVLRRAGVAVPTGQTGADLARLDALISHYRPAELLVLGDLVHGSAPAEAPWIAQVASWRLRHAELPMMLVAGNHDRHFDARQLGFDTVGERLDRGPFALCHEPVSITRRYVLAGHVHPGIMVRDGWRSHRLPVFRFTAGVGVLPAFGSLTGLHHAPLAAGETAVAVSPAGLIPVR